MTDQNTEIRRNADGSIDTNYYLAHCHRVRSLAAHREIGRAFAALKSVFATRRRAEEMDVPAAPATAQNASELVASQETTAVSRAA